MSDARVFVGDGVSVPESWVVVLREEPGVPGEVSVRAEYDAELRRTVATEVRVLRADRGDEVTSLTLREVRVQWALQVSGLSVSRIAEPDQPLAAGSQYIQRMRDRSDRNHWQSLVDATRLYQLAAAINLPPLRAVSDGLSISQSTATRLMNRARQEGLAGGVNLPEPRATQPPRREHATGPVVGPPTSGGPSIG
ncbi:hypothetical protein [Microbacterium sp.]|uniref:hypothetical protein n=1 Tax=Microbacterium sp. TaxID=51671 RepID=UPI003F70555A